MPKPELPAPTDAMTYDATQQEPENMIELATSTAEAQPIGAHFAGLIRHFEQQPGADREAAANDADLPGHVPQIKRAMPACAATADEKLQLRRVIAARLIQARTRAGLKQHEAARRLQMETPAQLSQWELSSRMMPLDKLIALATLYGCSVDFLLGASNDATRDSAAGLRESVLRGVRRQIEGLAEVVIDQVARHARLLGGNVRTVDSLLAAGDELLANLQKYMRLNQSDFDDRRGGASLVSAGLKFEDALLDVRQKVRLHAARDADLRAALDALKTADPALLDDIGGDDE